MTVRSYLVLVRGYTFSSADSHHKPYGLPNHAQEGETEAIQIKEGI